MVINLSSLWQKVNFFVIMNLSFMKKHFTFLLVLFILLLNSFSLEYTEKVPDLLKGIWQGNDRLILFAGEEGEFSCVLRVFYRWYDDRAAEPPSFAQISTRSKNDATAPRGENIKIRFATTSENSAGTAGAYELEVKYPGRKDPVYIPVAVINGNIYLNFYVKQQFDNGKYALCETGAASGITISPPIIRNELLSYFVDGSNVYHIRYWESEMDFSDDQAEFSDDIMIHALNKFISTAGKVFTCATGRSTRIRNIQKSGHLPENLICDEESLIFASGKPYLSYVPDSGTRETLLQRVKSDNSRMAPQPKPLFPPSNLDFHWKEIHELEKYNPFIKQLRNARSES